MVEGVAPAPAYAETPKRCANICANTARFRMPSVARRGLCSPAVTISQPNYCTICTRDSHGRIARSPEARQEFMTQTGYPHGRPGYVADHVIPLKRGGAAEPWNMQWQTIAEGKAKDATE
jgi:hypothetical protein